MEKYHHAVAQIRGHFPGHVLVVQGGKDHHHDVGAVQGLFHGGGGEGELAKALQRVMQLNAAPAVDGVHSGRNHVKQANGFTQEGKMAGDGLTAVAAADDCPRF